MKNMLFRIPTLLSIVILLPCCLPALGSPTEVEIQNTFASAAAYESGQDRTALRQIEEWTRLSLADRKFKRDLEKALIRLLQPASSFEARKFACQQLAFLGTGPSVSAISNLLGEEETVGIACLAFTTFPPGKADDALRRAARFARGNAQVQILNTLGDRRDAGAIKLMAGLIGAETAVAEAAIASLGKIGTRAAWEVLKKAQANAKDGMRPVMTEALLNCGASLAASGDYEAAAEIFEPLLEKGNDRHVRRSALAALIDMDEDLGRGTIMETLRGSDAELIPIAINSIDRLPASTTAAVAGEFSRLKPEQQAWLIESVAARSDKAGREIINAGLGSSEGVVRLSSIHALAQVGGPWSVELLARNVERATETDERRALESAFATLPGEWETDQRITQAIRTIVPARATLIAALTRRQGPAANPTLLEYGASEDAAAAKAALQALSRTASGNEAPALVAIVAAARTDEVRSEAEGAASLALSRLEKPAARSAIVREELAKEQSPEARCALLGLLPSCGDAEALALLKPALSDKEPKVRKAAATALSDWPDAAAWDVLQSVLQEGRSGPARAAALRGLVRIAGEQKADAQLVEKYRQLLVHAKTVAELKQILGGLGGVAHPDALELALSLRSSEGIRPEAEAAVRKIAEAIKASHPDAARNALTALRPNP